MKAKVKKQLDALGAYYFSPQSGIYGRSGVPDIIGCLGGKFFAIECKAGSNTTTGLQDKELSRIRAAAGLAMVINETNIGEVETCLRNF